MEFNDNAGVDTSQVEDMRGSSGGGFPGGGFSFPGGGMGLGGGILGLLVVVVLAFLGANGGGGGGGGNAPTDNSSLGQKCATSNLNRFQATDCRTALFVNSVQNYWQKALPQDLGRTYQPATTRLFTDAVTTACGEATSGVGPFYCPGDNHVYIDLKFYDQLASQFGAPGTFAQGYVLAHEYGHHVQSLTGTEAQVRRAQQRDPASANRYSILLELQADCYAGAWAKNATATTDRSGNAIFKSITAQDIQDALQAAAAVGDDTLQRKATGSINQDTWTHGSAQQRQHWFSQGYKTGDPRGCNTFGTAP